MSLSFPWLTFGSGSIPLLFFILWHVCSVRGIRSTDTRQLSLIPPIRGRPWSTPRRAGCIIYDRARTRVRHYVTRSSSSVRIRFDHTAECRIVFDPKFGTFWTTRSISSRRRDRVFCRVWRTYQCRLGPFWLRFARLYQGGQGTFLCFGHRKLTSDFRRRRHRSREILV